MVLKAASFRSEMGRLATFSANVLTGFYDCWPGAGTQRRGRPHSVRNRTRSRLGGSAKIACFPFNRTSPSGRHRSSGWQPATALFQQKACAAEPICRESRCTCLGYHYHPEPPPGNWLHPTGARLQVMEASKSLEWITKF